MPAVVELAETFVDFGQGLGFGGIVDHPRRPDRFAFVVIGVGAAVNFLEIFADGAAFDNFLVSGGNDIVFDLKVEHVAVMVDSLKPVFHAFEKLDIFAAFEKQFAGQRNLFVFGGLKHVIH